MWRLRECTPSLTFNGVELTESEDRIVLITSPSGEELALLKSIEDCELSMVDLEEYGARLLEDLDPGYYEEQARQHEQLSAFYESEAEELERNLEDYLKGVKTHEACPRWVYTDRKALEECLREEVARLRVKSADERATAEEYRRKAKAARRALEEGAALLTLYCTGGEARNMRVRLP